MSYNIMRVFEEISKIDNHDLAHPYDEKYTKVLEKREQAAKKKGCFFNPFSFMQE